MSISTTCSYCANRVNHTNYIGILDDDHPYIVAIRCRCRADNLFFCTVCQSRLRNQRAVRQHITSHHMTHGCPTQVTLTISQPPTHASTCDQLFIANESSFNPSNTLHKTSTTISTTPRLTKGSFDTFLSKITNIFFCQDYCHPGGGNGGKRGIFGRCFRGWHAQEFLATDDEIKLCLT